MTDSTSDVIAKEVINSEDNEPNKLEDKSTIPRPRRFTGSRKKKDSPCCSTSSDSTCVVERKISSRRSRANKKKVANQIPDEIMNDPELSKAISQLPWNYNFEIRKSIWKVRQANARRVALQFPEGLLLYSCMISDIIERFSNADTIILGDVTYGACCVDDLTAISLGADFMIHYGHSCLVPIDVTTIKMLYVFVDISIDLQHFIDCVKLTFPPETKLAIMGTIQFATAMHSAYQQLQDYYQDIIVPQARPLSRGEVLGCTSPVIKDRDVLVFIADGRFHLESVMISNPEVSAYRYDPYPKVLSLESYDITRMHQLRRKAIMRAESATKFGIILGTLGRQGNPAILDRMRSLLVKNNKPFIILLLSEIFPGKLEMFSDIDAWIQIACPRLSIDWGYAFNTPILTPYEAEVCLKQTEWRERYPMDYYAKTNNSWTNYYDPLIKDKK